MMKKQTDEELSTQVDTLLEEKDLTSVSFVPDVGFIEKSKYVPSKEEVRQNTFVQKGEFKIKDTTKEEIGPIELESKEPVAAPKNNDELVTDYQYIRTNLYTITERSVEALSNLVQIADQSQHPRAYEVVALMVNAIASAQKDLMNIHREKAKIDGIVAKGAPEVVNNNLFVGNTAQLDEIIKSMSKKKENE